MTHLQGTLRIDKGCVYAVRRVTPTIDGHECEVQLISTPHDPRPDRRILIRPASVVARWPTLEQAGLV